MTIEWKLLCFVVLQWAVSSFDLLFGFLYQQMLFSMFLSWAHVFPKLFLLCLSFNLSKFLPSIVFFLVVDTQLYKRLCPSIHLSVRWSVGPPARVEKWENKRSRTFLVANSCISAPAHLSATDGRVSGLVLHDIELFSFKNDERLLVFYTLNEYWGNAHTLYWTIKSIFKI